MPWYNKQATKLSLALSSKFQFSTNEYYVYGIRQMIKIAAQFMIFSISDIDSFYRTFRARSMRV